MTPEYARALGQMQRWQAGTLAGSDGPLVDQADKQLRILSAVLDTGWRTASWRAEAEVQARQGRALRESPRGHLCARRGVGASARGLSR